MIYVIYSLRQALLQMKIDGILVDSFVADYHAELFDGLRVNKVLKNQKSYGFVLGRRLSTTKMFHKFNSYYNLNKNYALSLVMNSTSSHRQVIIKSYHFHIFYQRIDLFSFFG